MKRKGQITIFIIIGIVLILITSVMIMIFYSQEDTAEEKLDMPEANSVREYLRNCFDANIDTAIVRFASQGGYSQVSDPNLDVSDFGLNINTSVPYYIYDGRLDMISLDLLNTELGMISGRVFSEECNDLSMFNYEVTIDYSNIDIVSSIAESMISFDIKVPVRVRIGEKVTEFNRIILSKRSNLYQMYQCANELTQDQIGRADSVCMSCQEEIVEKYNLSMDIIQFEDDSRVSLSYSLFDPDYLGDDYEEMVYNFAFRIPVETVGQGPEIEAISQLNATIGYRFSYQVNATGEGIRFFDDSGLFNIDMFTGLISFTPEYEDTGSYIVKVWVVDENGEEAEEIFTLKVGNVGYRPDIEYIGYLETESGEVFRYDVNGSSSSDGGIFIDDSDLFDINSSDGVIEFVPDIYDIGLHLFNISFIDSSGNIGMEEVTLNIY